jgi:hypothetical protein
MPKNSKIDLAALTIELEAISERLQATTLTAPARKKLQNQARRMIEDLGSILQQVDPIRAPSAVFDPSNPNVMGAVTALALVAQPRTPMPELDQHYGSGIYAIYYTGDFDLYRDVSGTETPIYVGQAAPAVAGARNPFEQGPRLSRRLSDHKRSIKSAHKTLALADFEARTLVVQSKWESPAESYLINLFKPIWNKEVGLVFGIGKHGDKATTRSNKRSPWDVIHDSRAWATTDASRSRSEIESAVAEHFHKNPPLRTVDDVFEHFLGTLRQSSTNI